MGDKSLLYCGACCCCTALIVGIILFIISFAVLEATEMGLDYSDVGKSIDHDTLYESGRHLLGVGHSFRVYPKDQQSTKFPDEKYGSLEARTVDGLEVILEVQYQFRLQPDLASVVRIYYDWGLRFELAYAIVARNILRDIASNWTAYQFFYNRTEIEAAMQYDLQTRIEQDGGMLDDLQLLDITLPTAFESELTKTESIRQEIEQINFDVQDAIVRAENKRKRMFDEAKVISNTKKVEAQRMINEKTQAIVKVEESMVAELRSYSAIQTGLNLQPANMFNYVWLQNLMPGGINHIRVARPVDLHCYADPFDAKCPPKTQPNQEFTCTQGSTCALVIDGSNLKDEDRVRLATDSTCETKHALAGQQQYVANVGPSVTQKVYSVGTIASNTTMSVCYCRYSYHAQGCDHNLMGSDLPSGLYPAFEETGTLTVM